MSKSVYIASPEGLTGKAVIALGIIEALRRENRSIGVFRPLVNSSVERDRVIELLISQPGVDVAYDEAAGVTYEAARANPDDALAQIIDRYGALASRKDVVVIVGSDYEDVAAPTEFAFNASIAANLNAPVALVIGGQNRTPKRVRMAAEHALVMFRSKGLVPVAVFANRVDPSLVEATDALLREIPDVVVAALPDDPDLSSPTFRQQVEAVGGTFTAGSPESFNRESREVLITSMTLPNVLARLVPHATLITPSDRTDLIPGLILAHKSPDFPQLTGMILVGGYEMPATVQRLVASVDSDLPIATAPLGAYHTAQQLFPVRGAMSKDAPEKVAAAKRIFHERIDVPALMAAIDSVSSKLRTPLMFQYQLQELAQAGIRTIVLPEASDDRILTSAAILLRRGIADIILLGDAAEIGARASALGLDLNAARIVSPRNPVLVEKFAAEYTKLRAHKGMTLEKARETLKDLSYFGTMMVHFGMADGMVSGAVNTTANTIRPSLEFIKTRPGTSIVSSSFLMCLPDRVVVYADCAVNPDPTAEQLADIAISSVDTALKFGIEPRVAMLSYSTGDSGSGEDVDKVRAATEIVRARMPELKVDGPIQFDAAVDLTVGSKKMPGSEVAGQATVFIFPDLNTGNNTYKAVQRTSGAVAVGPVLQGLNKPVNDLSRGALVDDIVNTVAITAIQAQAEPSGTSRA
ncbi:MAG TPA: phosphate acetyltransferase [Propionibacteriaceae bacterium]|nr:phosphate acetyltransferase [Propionibacteriaceae bacterium]